MIGGPLLDNNYRQLANNFFLYPFFFRRLRGAVSELNSDAIDKVKSGYQPLQETNGLRIKFAGNKRNRQKAIRNKQKAIRAGSLLSG